VYTGKTAYRGLIPAERLLSIPGFPDAVTFWHGPKDWVYTCNLRHGVYELTCLANVSDERKRKKVSWGEGVILEEFKRPWKVWIDSLNTESRLTILSGADYIVIFWPSCTGSSRPGNRDTAISAFCRCLPRKDYIKEIYCIDWRCVSSYVIQKFPLSNKTN
jgi:hypothetical protein